MKGLTRRMSDKHEDDLVRDWGGRKTKGSGNQFNNPMDGRRAHDDPLLRVAWDGKSTMGKSVGITREMWDKAVEQAQGDEPILALRWYDGEVTLKPTLDLVAVSKDYLEALWEAAGWEGP